MTHLDKPILFLATADAERSRAFYERVLGLDFVSDEPPALVFKVGHSMLRIQKVETFAPHSFTALGWQVSDIGATVATLQGRGVTFETFAGMNQDQRGIWRSPSGARVAWFKDPDGNTLSLSQI